MLWPENYIAVFCEESAATGNRVKRRDIVRTSESLRRCAYVVQGDHFML
jgi:hypothetical protein